MKKYYLMSAAVVILFVCIFAAVGFIFAFLYPMKYKDEIKTYAHKYGLEPQMVASIINVESGFDKNATSGSGAVGLMQLMPNTAIEIAGILNYEDFKIADLYIPAVNIEFGCYYLKYLNYIFYGNTNNVLASYNAGLTYVNYWLSDEKFSPDGVTIQLTPFKETNNFIDRVKRNYNIYSKYF